jgi:hypothetical protein
MDWTRGIGRLNGIGELLCPPLGGSGGINQRKSRLVHALFVQMLFQSAEVIDAEELLRNEKTAREYEIH